MLSTINLIFKNKYPFEKKKRKHYAIAFSLTLWVFVFLWFTEPFELYRFGLNKKIQVIPLYGIFSGLSYCLAMLLQNHLYKKYNHWTVLFETIFLVLALIIASIFMYTIYYFGIDHYNKAYSYFKYVRLIFTPSLVIILPFIIISRRLIVIWSKNNNQENSHIIIKGSGKYEVLQVRREQIIYVKSDNVYVDIFFEEENKIKSQSIRIKLSEIELQLPELIKTHRSYVVNSDFFRGYKKENDKFFVELKYDLMIPVSRAKKENVLKILPLTT